MAPQTQSRFAELVAKGWDKVTGEFTEDLSQKENIRKNLYAEMKGDSAYWEKYGISNLPDIPRFNGILTQIEHSPGYGVRIEPAEFGAYTEMEKKLYENNLYAVMKGEARDLSLSLNRTKLKLAVKGYAKLNSAAFDFMSWNEEGVAIASSSHTTKADGVSTSSGFANLGTYAFDPTIVESTRVTMRGFKLLNGEYADVNPDGFIGPTTLEQKFKEVNGTPKGLYSAEGTINVQAGKWEFLTHQYFNDYSTKNWIMIDWELAKRAALWINRLGPESSAEVDFMTKRIKAGIYDYFGYGFIAWQPFYFQQVS